MKYKYATQEGGWIGILKIILANPHNEQSNVLIKIESNKFNQSTIIKEQGKREQTQGFLRGSAIPAYVHASKRSKLEDFTIRAFPRLQPFTIDFKVSMNLYNKEIISQSLHSSVSHTQTLTNELKKWKIQWNSLNE